MVWVWEELINTMIAGFSTLLDTLANAVLQSFGLGSKSFEYYAAIFMDNYELLTGFGMGLTLLIMLMALLKLLFAPFFEAVENPILLVGRFCMAMVLVYHGRSIGNYIIDFFSGFYSTLMGMSSGKTAGEVMVYKTIEMTADLVAEGPNITLPVVSAIEGVFGALGSIVALLFGLVLIVILTVEFLKLVLEGVERYIVFNLLLMFFPLAGSTMTSSSTSRIFFTYVKMAFNEALLLCMNVLFIRGSIYIMQNCFNAELGEVTAGVQTNVLLSFIFLMAFMKTGQRVDAYMKTLGLDVAQTGGSILDEMFMAARTVAGIGRAIGGAISSGRKLGAMAANNFKNAMNNSFPGANLFKNKDAAIPGTKAFSDSMNAASMKLADAFKKNGVIPEGHAKTIAKGMQDAHAAMHAVEKRCGSAENYGNLLKQMVPGLNGLGIQGAELVKNGAGRLSDNKIKFANGTTGTLSYNKPANGTPFKTLKDINGNNMFLSTGGQRIAGKQAVRSQNATKAAVSKALGMDVNGFNGLGGDFDKMAQKNGAKWGDKMGTPAELGFNGNQLQDIMQNASNPRQALALMTGNKADAFDGMTYDQIANQKGMVGDKEGKLADIGFDADKVKDICETGGSSLPKLMGNEQFANDVPILADALGMSEADMDNVKCMDIGGGSVALYDGEGNMIGTLDTPESNLDSSVGTSIAHNGDVCDYKVNPNVLAGMDDDRQLITDGNDNMYSRSQISDAINDTLGTESAVSDINMSNNVATASMSNGSEVYMDQRALDSGSVSMVSSDVSTRDTANALRDGSISYDAETNSIIASNSEGLSASIPATALNSADAMSEEAFVNSAPGRALNDISTDNCIVSARDDAITFSNDSGASATIPISSIDTSSTMSSIRDDFMSNVNNADVSYSAARDYSTPETINFSAGNENLSIPVSSITATPLTQSTVDSLISDGTISRGSDGALNSNSNDLIATSAGVFKTSDVATNVREIVSSSEGTSSITSEGRAAISYGDGTVISSRTERYGSGDNSSTMSAIRDSFISNIHDSDVSCTRASRSSAPETINFSAGNENLSIPVSSITATPLTDSTVNSLVSDGTITRDRSGALNSNSNDLIVTSAGVFKTSDVATNVREIVSSSEGRATITSEGRAAISYGDGTVISSRTETYTNDAINKFNNLSASTPQTLSINERGSSVSKYEDGTVVTGRSGRFTNTEKGIYDSDSVSNSVFHATKDRTPTRVEFNEDSTRGTMTYGTGVTVTAPTVRNENVSNFTVNQTEAPNYTRNVPSLSKAESDRLYESVKGKDRGGTPTRVRSERIENGVRHHYSNGDMIDMLHPMPGEEGDSFELRGKNVLVRDGLKKANKKGGYNKGGRNQKGGYGFYGKKSDK